MIRIYERFDKREQADAFKARIYIQYHPAGYGTSLTVTETSTGVVVSGSRYSSCD